MVLAAASSEEADDPDIVGVTCRHCRCRRSTRPRGLCKKCWLDPLTRRRYDGFLEMPSRVAPRFDLLERTLQRRRRRHRLPTTKTDAAPGSEEKILVLIERASRLEVLFHPEDPRISNDPT